MSEYVRMIFVRRYAIRRDVRKYVRIHVRKSVVRRVGSEYMLQDSRYVRTTVPTDVRFLTSSARPCPGGSFGKEMKRTMTISRMGGL
jgi:hypothetical protein